MKSLRLYIIFFIAAAMLTGGVFLFPSSSEQTEECDNVFSSGVYRDYHRQLQSIIRSQPVYHEIRSSSESPLAVKMNALIDHVETPLPDNNRAFHEAFVMQLRGLIEGTDPLAQDPNSQMVDAIVRWIFLEADLNDSYRKFIDFDLDGDPLSAIASAQQELRSDSRFSGRESETKEEDSFLCGNLPTVYRFDPIGGPERVIRWGKPLSYASRRPWYSAVVSPEFRRFIALRPGHLYVNLMRRKGREGRNSRAIEELEKEYRNFYVITLDKDSSFYWQKDAGIDDAALFKKSFLEKMIDDSGNFYWSKRLDPSWEDELETILDRVHAIYFPRSVRLDAAERKDFIELTYLEIIDTLNEKWDCPSMNMTCSQGMDRGPSLLVLWEMKNTVIDDREIASHLLVPPLLIHNRPSHTSRIQRFVSAAKRL